MLQSLRSQKVRHDLVTEQLNNKNHLQENNKLFFELLELLHYFSPFLYLFYVLQELYVSVIYFYAQESFIDCYYLLTIRTIYKTSLLYFSTTKNMDTNLFLFTGNIWS